MNKMEFKISQSIFTCRLGDSKSYILNINGHKINSVYSITDKIKDVIDDIISNNHITNIVFSEDDLCALLLLSANELLDFTIDGVQFSKSFLKNSNNLIREMEDCAKDVNDFYNYIYLNNSLFSVKIEITSLCNLNCRYCYMGGSNNTYIKAERWINILKYLKDLGVVRLEITGGEPLLYRDIRILVKAADSLGFDTTICTNGILIDDDFINFLKTLRSTDLRISFHSVDQSVFDHFVQVKGAYCSIKGVLTRLLGEEIPFTTWTTLTSLNENTIYSTIDFLQDLQIKYEISPYIFPNIYKNNSNSNFRPSADIFENLIALGYLSRKKSKCSALKTKFWISCNGDVYPCEMYKNTKITNIFKSNLRDVWSSVVTDNLRKTLINNQSNCTTCKQGFYCNHCPAICHII
jgi:radical SAM protein with 4Fe4S-binding SPASM domain